jgi:hypothetical protein
VLLLLKTSPQKQLALKTQEQLAPKPHAQLALQGFKIILGPDLRVVYPFFLNFGVSGELELNGVADPLLIKPKGTVQFENGDVNLVATQVKLNRDHQNKAIFVPEQVGFHCCLSEETVGA